MKLERPTNPLQPSSNLKNVKRNGNNCRQLKRMGSYVEWTKRLINVQRWDVWKLGDLAIIFIWVKRLVSYVLFTWSRSSVVLFWLLFKLYYFLLEASRIISNLDRKRRSSPQVATELDDDPLVDDIDYYVPDDRGYSAYGPAEVNWEDEDPMRCDLFLDKFVGRGKDQRRRRGRMGASPSDDVVHRRYVQGPRPNQRKKKRRIPTITIAGEVGTDDTRRTSSRGAESDVDSDIDAATGSVDADGAVGEGKRVWMNCTDGAAGVNEGETGEAQVAYRWEALTQSHQPRETRHHVLTK